MMMNNRFAPYDKKYLIKCLLGIGLMVVLMKISQGAGYVLLLPLMLFAIMRKNPLSLLFYLVLAIISMVGNHNFLPKGALYGYAQRASMLMLAGCMLVKIFGRRSNRILSPFMGMLAYIVYMALTASEGWCPLISYLKLILFSAVYFAYYGVAVMAVESNREISRRIRSVFLAVAIFFIFGSVVLLPFPGLAQMSGEAYLEALNSGEQITSLFAGMTFHPQALGPVCAVLGVALFADMVISVGRADRLYVALIACVPILLLKTSSRTAIASFVFGICVISYFMMNNRRIKAGWRSRVFGTLIAIFACLALSVLFIPSMNLKVANILLKYNADNVGLEQVTTDEIFKTRQGKWDQCMENFTRSPAIGNGFQVSETMVGQTASFRTMSAPVEKSVWIAAILEEGGVFGFLIFIVFVFSVLLAMLKNHAYIGLSAFLLLLITNLGEFTMFSMSGVGGTMWAIVFICIILDSQRVFPPKIWKQFF